MYEELIYFAIWRTEPVPRPETVM